MKDEAQMTNLHPFIQVVLKNHVSWEQWLPLDVEGQTCTRLQQEGR